MSCSVRHVLALAYLLPLGGCSWAEKAETVTRSRTVMEIAAIQLARNDGVLEARFAVGYSDGSQSTLESTLGDEDPTVVESGTAPLLNVFPLIQLVEAAPVGSLVLGAPLRRVVAGEVVTAPLTKTEAEGFAFVAVTDGFQGPWKIVLHAPPLGGRLVACGTVSLDPALARSVAVRPLVSREVVRRLPSEPHAKGLDVGSAIVTLAEGVVIVPMSLALAPLVLPLVLLAARGIGGH